MRRLVDNPVRARVAVGTLFVAGTGSVQDMLALAPRNVMLEGKRWVAVDVDAACADISSAIPGGQDALGVPEAPAELGRIARQLRSEEDVAVRQAAVWIVSDDANFYSLGP